MIPVKSRKHRCAGSAPPGAGAKAVDRANPCATKIHRLDENVGAASIELTPIELDEIARAIADIRIEGDRYPKHLAALVGR